MSDTPLWDRYWGSFGVCSVVCIVLQLYARNVSAPQRKRGGQGVFELMGLTSPPSPSRTGEPSSSSSSSSSLSLASSPSSREDAASEERRRQFAKFQRNYLAVYLLAVFADWLQGPYVYELYVYYGFDKGQISELFVCGFASSMIMGTFVGGLADKFGRKKMCILYSILYVVACFTKLVNRYSVLMLGRFLSGISTSLLFSVFESWMVCEHNRNGFDSALLADTFARQTFGNGVVAVIAGLVANTAADAFGYVAPFMISIVPLVLLAVLAGSTWSENYGNSTLGVGYLTSLGNAFELIRSDARLAALGMAQSCYEGALYTFIFIWTPALKTVEEVIAEASGDAAGADPGERIVHSTSSGRAAAAAAALARKDPLNQQQPVEYTSQYLGIIFAVFMICVMIGSSIFRLLTVRGDATVSMAVTPTTPVRVRSPADLPAKLFRIPLYVHLVATASMGCITLFLRNKLFVYIMFLVFEGTTGVFYPVYGMIKSKKIPEDSRSAVMNILRIPLNVFVVLLLLKFKYLSSEMVISVCTLGHGVAFASYAYFYYTIKGEADEDDAAAGEDREALLWKGAKGSSSEE